MCDNDGDTGIVCLREIVLSWDCVIGSFGEEERLDLGDRER